MAKTPRRQRGKNRSKGGRPQVRQGPKDDQPTKGRTLAALRRSPLVGSDLDLTREVVEPRKIDL